jgi:hypothetical protein
MDWSEFKSDWVYYSREAILRVLAISLIVFGLIVLPSYLFLGCYYPSDRVQAIVDNVQPDVNWLWIVAETSEGPIALEWYHEALLGQTHQSFSGYVGDMRNKETEWNGINLSRRLLA